MDGRRSLDLVGGQIPGKGLDVPGRLLRAAAGMERRRPEAEAEREDWPGEAGWDQERVSQQSGFSTRWSWADALDSLILVKEVGNKT